MRARKNSGDALGGTQSKLLKWKDGSRSALAGIQLNLDIPTTLYNERPWPIPIVYHGVLLVQLNLTTTRQNPLCGWYIESRLCLYLLK